MRVQVAAPELNRFERLDRGPLRQVTLFSQAARILRQRKVAERRVAGAVAVLESLHVPTRSQVDYDPSFSAGSALCIAGEFANTVIGASGLGALGKRAEEMGREAAEDFAREFRIQPVSIAIWPIRSSRTWPCAAIAARVSFRANSHCRTNMWVIEKFLNGRFQIQDHTIAWTTG